MNPLVTTDLVNLLQSFAPLLAVLAVLAWRPAAPRQWRRFRAAVLDAAIAGALFLPCWLIGNRAGNATPETNLLSLLPITGATLATGFLLLRDGLAWSTRRRRSPGKSHYHLRVRVLDGSPMRATLSLLRNLPLAVTLLLIIPGCYPVIVAILLIECLLIHVTPTGRRLGDRLAGTEVITRQQQSPS